MATQDFGEKDDDWCLTCGMKRSLYGSVFCSSRCFRTAILCQDQPSLVAGVSSDVASARSSNDSVEGALHSSPDAAPAVVGGELSSAALFRSLQSQLAFRSCAIKTARDRKRCGAGHFLSACGGSPQDIESIEMVFSEDHGVDLDWCIQGCGDRARIGSIYCSQVCFRAAIQGQDDPTFAELLLEEDEDDSNSLLKNKPGPAAAGPAAPALTSKTSNTSLASASSTSSSFTSGSFEQLAQLYLHMEFKAKNKKKSQTFQ
ncbi:hypothetical protein HDU91_006515 [Kappamyces sp. JEL0680]|nr:hypothetical protein HDU91_006515 [Kappamyces sp. JEL0680]